MKAVRRWSRRRRTQWLPDDRLERVSKTAQRTALLSSTDAPAVPARLHRHPRSPAPPPAARCSLSPRPSASGDRSAACDDHWCVRVAHYQIYARRHRLLVLSAPAPVASPFPQPHRGRVVSAVLLVWRLCHCCACCCVCWLHGLECLPGASLRQEVQMGGK